MKPSIGLIPREIWRDKTLDFRRKDIIRAISAYNEAEIAFPIEWILELQEINKELTRETSSRT